MDTLTKHGSTFKATSRSKYYLKVLDKIINARINNTIDEKFIEGLYDLSGYDVEDFIMRRSMHRKKDEYKSQTDLILNLIEQGEAIGIEPVEGTTYFYVKTKVGYRLATTVKDKNEIDMRYYWDTISGLLQKFKLNQYVRKKPPLNSTRC